MGKLNENQLKQLADFTANLGLIFFATIIAPVFADIDKINLINVVLGLTAGITCLMGSLLLHVEVRKE